MAVVPAAAAAAVLAVDIAETVLIQVVGQLVAGVLASALAPELLELQQESFKLTNTRALDPALSIDAYIKGYRSQAKSMDDVGAAGYDGELWQAMADTAGEPLPLLALTEAWRRGIIAKAGGANASTSLEQGIKDSRLKDKWIPVIEALQFQLAPPGVVVEGILRAQISEADGRKILYENGIDDATATLMIKAAGRPPSPEELLTLWRRGQLPESGIGPDALSVDQGYLETDLKDKWLAKWKLLKEYRPPARVVVALLRASAITDAQGLQMLQDEGLSPELAAIYVKDAHHQRSATTRELTKAEWVAMYVDQAITADKLTAQLVALGYTAEDAALEVSLADLKVKHSLEARAVSRVGTLYVGRKIDKQAAQTTLATIPIPQPQIDQLLKIWALERGDNLKHLTGPELGWLVKNGLLDEATALNDLAAQGYGAEDAWLVLSYETKVQLTTPRPTSNLPPA